MLRDARDRREIHLLVGGDLALFVGDLHGHRGPAVDIALASARVHKIIRTVDPVAVAVNVQRFRNRNNSPVPEAVVPVPFGLDRQFRCVDSGRQARLIVQLDLNAVAWILILSVQNVPALRTNHRSVPFHIQLNTVRGPYLVSSVERIFKTRDLFGEFGVTSQTGPKIGLVIQFFLLCPGVFLGAVPIV